MDKRADLTGETTNETIMVTEGGVGSQNQNMVDQLNQNRTIPKRQQAGKMPQPVSTPMTPTEKLAFMRGYLCKEAAAYTGPMGNPGPQLSQPQQYAMQNDHGMGASTLQTVPSLKPPDPALEAAAGVGGSKSAKPFSGVTADRKADTNMQGASTMNNGDGMGISSTQRNKSMV
jgi:hypothetical protein